MDSVTQLELKLNIHMSSMPLSSARVKTPKYCEIGDVFILIKDQFPQRTSSNAKDKFPSCLPIVSSGSFELIYSQSDLQ